jgi:hypothetical protein
VVERSRSSTRQPLCQIGIAFARGDPVAPPISAGDRGASAFRGVLPASPPPRGGDLSQLERALAFYRSVGATRYVA